MIINRILRKSGHFRYRRNIPFNFNPRFILLLPPIRTVKQALTFYLLKSHVFAALPNLKSIALFKFSVNKGKTCVLPLEFQRNSYRYTATVLALFYFSHLPDAPHGSTRPFPDTGSPISSAST